MNEFAIAYDEGRLSGVLSGTGGITAVRDEVPAVTRKDRGARVIVEPEPLRLVDRLLETHRTAHYWTLVLLRPSGRRGVRAA